MLPAASHATSVGRLKLSPSAPAPGSAPPRPPPPRPPPPGRRQRRAAAACRRGRRRALGGGLHDRHAGRQRRQRQRRHAHRFRLAAQDHLHAAVRIELDHLRRHLIDDPDVVLRIDADLLRLQQPVRALADLADELAGPIELEQARAAVRDGARRAERDRRVAGARVDEDVALGVGRHAGRFAQVDVVGQLQQIGVRVELQSPGSTSCADEQRAAGRGERDAPISNELGTDRFIGASRLLARRRWSAPSVASG